MQLTKLFSWQNQKNISYMVRTEVLSSSSVCASAMTREARTYNAICCRYTKFLWNILYFKYIFFNFKKRYMNDVIQMRKRLWWTWKGRIWKGQRPVAQSPWVGWSQISWQKWACQHNCVASGDQLPEKPKKVQARRGTEEQLSYARSKTLSAQIHGHNAVTN